MPLLEAIQKLWLSSRADLRKARAERDQAALILDAYMKQNALAYLKAAQIGDKSSPVVKQARALHDKLVAIEKRIENLRKIFKGVDDKLFAAW